MFGSLRTRDSNHGKRQGSLRVKEKDSDPGPLMDEWILNTTKRQHSKNSQGLAPGCGLAINKTWC